MSQLEQDPASFRDPSGNILNNPQGAYQSIDRERYELAGNSLQCPACSELVEKGLLIPTELVDDAAPTTLSEEEGLPDGFYFQHKKLWFISYLYEWTTGMFVDAARCTFSVQATLLEHGFTLKEALIICGPISATRARLRNSSTSERPSHCPTTGALAALQAVRWPLLSPSPIPPGHGPRLQRDLLERPGWLRPAASLSNGGGLPVAFSALSDIGNNAPLAPAVGGKEKLRPEATKSITERNPARKAPVRPEPYGAFPSAQSKGP